MKRTKILALVLAGVMALSLAACGTTSEQPGDASANNEPASSATSEAEAKDEIVIAMDSAVTDMSPNGAMTEPDRIVQMNIYEPLCYYEGDTLVYRLATNIEKTDDTHYSVTLREGVKDTAGNAFTASDVAYSLRYCGQTDQFASLVQHVDLDNIEIIDDYNLVIPMKDAYTSQMDIWSSIDIFDEDSMAASEDGMLLNPVGYGAYKLESYTAGSEIVLTANEDFYLGSPAIKKVTMIAVAEASQRTNALVAGDVDVAYKVQTNDVDYINETDGIECVEYPTLSMAGLVMNFVDSSPTSDINVRKAIAYAIDNVAIASTYYKGHAVPATDLCSVDASADYFEGWDTVAAKYDNYYERNVEKAKECLKTAGYENGLTIRGMYASDAEMATMVQSMLEEVGITFELTQYDMPTCIAIANGEKEKWDVWFTGWLASTPNSLDLMGMHLLGLNGAAWEGPEFGKMAETINVGLVTTDEAAQQELIVEAHDMATNYLPHYSIANTNSIWGIKSGIEMKFSYEAACLPDFYSWSWK